MSFVANDLEVTVSHKATTLSFVEGRFSLLFGESAYLGLRLSSVSITWNCKLSCYMPSGVELRLPSVSTIWNCTLLILMGPGRGPQPHTLPHLAGCLAGVRVRTSWERHFLPLIGAGVCPVASYKAVEIADTVKDLESL